MNILDSITFFYHLYGVLVLLFLFIFFVVLTFVGLKTKRRVIFFPSLLIVVISLLIMFFGRKCWSSGWGGLSGIGDQCTCNGLVVKFYVPSPLLSYQYTCFGIVEEPAEIFSSSKFYR